MCLLSGLPQRWWERWGVGRKESRSQEGSGDPHLMGAGKTLIFYQRQAAGYEYVAIHRFPNGWGVVIVLSHIAKPWRLFVVRFAGNGRSRSDRFTLCAKDHSEVLVTVSPSSGYTHVEGLLRRVAARAMAPADNGYTGTWLTPSQWLQLFLEEDGSL